MDPLRSRYLYGTIINDVNIRSLAPFPLSDGDIIKIGETTSMSVKIDDGGDGEAEGGLRRGKRRGARARVVEEGDDDDFVEESKNLGRGRARMGNSSRVSKKDEDLNAVVEDNMVRPRKAGLRTRPAASKKNETVDLVIEDSIEKPKNVKKGRSRKAPARTQASSAKVPENDKLVLSDSVAKKIVEQGEPNVENIAAHNGRKEKGNGEEEKEKRVEEEKGKRVEEEINVDLEKMTLGEWFDSMEMYLPQAINEAAEEVIASLRVKARLFDKYIVNVSKERELFVSLTP